MQCDAGRGAPIYIGEAFCAYIHTALCDKYNELYEYNALDTTYQRGTWVGQLRAVRGAVGCAHFYVFVEFL